MRGVNDDEILDFAALTLDKPYTVRFIEYKPTGKEADGGHCSWPETRSYSATVNSSCRFFMAEAHQLTRLTHKYLPRGRTYF